MTMPYSPQAIAALNEAAKKLVDDIDRYIERMYPDTDDDDTIYPPNSVGDALCAITETISSMVVAVSPDDHKTHLLVKGLDILLTLYEATLRRYPMPKQKGSPEGPQL